MRRLLRIIALIIVAGGAVYWAAAGANRGWTKTTRTHMARDAVTEIEYPVVEKHFSPGIDLLAGSIFVAAALAVGSFVMSRKNNA